MSNPVFEKPLAEVASAEWYGTPFKL